VVYDVIGFLRSKVSKIRGRKVDAVAMSIEHGVLSVEPWEVRKKKSRLALKEAPSIPGCTI
jgi:hypothetical protein